MESGGTVHYLSGRLNKLKRSREKLRLNGEAQRAEDLGSRSWIRPIFPKSRRAIEASRSGSPTCWLRPQRIGLHVQRKRKL
jgi:hypothetical protein